MHQVARRNRTLLVTRATVCVKQEMWRIALISLRLTEETSAIGSGAISRSVRKKIWSHHTLSVQKFSRPLFVYTLTSHQRSNQGCFTVLCPSPTPHLIISYVRLSLRLAGLIWSLPSCLFNVHRGYLPGVSLPRNDVDQYPPLKK